MSIPIPDRLYPSILSSFFATRTVILDPISRSSITPSFTFDILIQCSTALVLLDVACVFELIASCRINQLLPLQRLSSTGSPAFIYTWFTSLTINKVTFPIYGTPMAHHLDLICFVKWYILL